MIDLNKIIKMLTEDEIQKIIKILEEELKTRKNERNYYFNSSFVPRKYHPYVAKLRFEDGRIKREFVNLKREYRFDEVKVHGVYKAAVGTVIEYRRDEERFWCIVNSKGQLITYTAFSNKEGRGDIINYLKGKLTLDDIERKLEEDEDRYLI